MPSTIRHPANFVSTIHQPVRAVADFVVNPANSAGSTLNAIRAAVDAGGVAIKRRAYAVAIEEYKTAQGLCFQLLNPSHKIGQYVGLDALVHPVGKPIEQALATAGLKLIEGIQPDVAVFTPPIVLDAVALDGDARRLTPLGFQLKAAGARDLVTRGTTLLAQGRPDEAALVLGEAVALMRNDERSEPGLRAAALLNLSTTQMAAGDPGAAARSAGEAGEQFVAAQDVLGEAQALHAGGVALQRAGQPDQANVLLTRAAERFAAATAAAGPEAGRVPAPAESGIGRLVQRSRLDLLDRGPLLTRVDRDVLLDRVVTSDVLLNDLTVATPSRAVAPATRPTTDAHDLTFIAKVDVSRVSLRWPTEQPAFSSVQVDDLSLPVARRHDWSVGLPVGDAVESISWSGAQPPTADVLLDTVYRPRLTASTIAGLRWWCGTEATTAAYLTHLYAYVLPVGLGDAYAESGNFERAETYYLQAADYSFLNPSLEAPALWTKLAQNTLAWADAAFRAEDVETAKAVYAKLVRSDGTPDLSTPLYAKGAFTEPADQAQRLLADPDDPPPTVNPSLAQVLYTALARWQYLNAGLDFYGLTFTPIFTFGYLQETARAFALQAIQAEREYVNFQVQAEAEAASRRDLQSSLTMADLDAAAQAQLAVAAATDAQAAAAAVRLAELRVDNAREDREGYREAGYWQYISSSIATAHGAGADWHSSEIRKLARDMEAGSWSGDRGKLAAAATLLGGQKSYEYQLGRMQNQIEEMQATLPIAQAQQQAATSRARAAQLQAQAAQQRAALVADALNAFENEVFTPELWTRMARLVREISASYQHWAIAAAKLMERAYNFENDTALRVIRPEYSVPATGDLLGSDLLLRDVDSFTYHYVANVTKKESALKDVLSLRSEYPFQFREFLTTGRMTFETSLYDFARRHPGFFGQRLAAVEVQVVGLLPPEGVRGTLRGGVVSHYAQADGSERSRVHSLDTLALSEYTLRGDAYVFRADARELGLFEGHGVATTWEIDLPRGSNNLDYRLISDVQLVLYYTARHSDALRDATIAAPPRPGEDVHVRDFAMRFDFPEVWFAFLRSRTATWTLDASYLPRNEESFAVKTLAVALIGPEGVPLDDVKITVGLPGRAAVTRTTDATGAVSAENNNSLADAMGGDLLGEWTLTIDPPAGSPLLLADGTLDPAKLSNIALIAEYSFAFRV